MASTTLLVGAACSFASALAYAYAGRRLGQRDVAGPAHASWLLFLTWWYAVAGLAFVSGVLQSIAAAGFTSLDVFVVGQHVSFLLLCVAHFGLLYYLVTLFTGRWQAWKPLVAFYLVFYLILLYDVSAGDSGAVEIGRWRTGLAYTSTLSPAIAAAIYSLLIVPPLFGSLAHLALYPRAKERSSRFRIVLVSTSIFLWAIVIAMPTWQDVDAIQFGARLLGFFLAFAIIAAYYPPRWLQRRLRVEAVSGS